MSNKNQQPPAAGKAQPTGEDASSITEQVAQDQAAAKADQEMDSYLGMGGSTASAPASGNENHAFLGATDFGGPSLNSIAEASEKPLVPEAAPGSIPPEFLQMLRDLQAQVARLEGRRDEGAVPAALFAPGWLSNKQGRKFPATPTLVKNARKLGLVPCDPPREYAAKRGLQ